MKKLVPYPVRVELRRAARWLANAREHCAFAQTQSEDPDAFPFELMAHSSKLLRQLAPELMPLQQNKVVNLELACRKLDRLLIKPGEIFSFCNIVGRTSKRKGYLNGLEMHSGKMIGAPGGGLCQIANLLYWMALHLDLLIIERHHHEMDLFPDDERSVPFGMGASVFYNYIDLRFRNNLPQPLLLRISVSDQLLRGEIMSDRDKLFDVVVSETLHRFVRADDGSVWRENRVVKQVTYRDGNSTVEDEIAHNLARVCYQVSEDMIEHSSR